MSSNKCAKCDSTVYPVEGLRCLDKIWHKGCFKCHECNMTLNLNNYKGFEKRPYCNAHCPQAKATTVADTPEIRRLAENTRIQSQAKYHEDFEKSKGKGFTPVADDPETRRIKENSKIISNVAYHGELERKKQMEEKRGLSGAEDLPSVKSSSGVLVSNNNNNGNNTNSKQHNNRLSQNIDHEDYNRHHHSYETQQQQQQQFQQNQRQAQILHQQQLLQQHQQHQQHQQKQQILLKQQHHPQHASVQPIMNRHSAHFDNPMHPQAINAGQLQHAPMNHAQQQQLLLRQHQSQQQLLIQQQQQHRHSLDGASLQMNRQPSKQAMITNLSHGQLPMKHQHVIGGHQPIKYMQMNEVVPNNQVIQSHLVGAPPHLMNPSQANSHRVGPNPALGGNGGPPPPHMNAPMIINYNQNHIGQVNGGVPKQQQFISNPDAMQQHVMRQQAQPMMHHQQQIRPLMQQQMPAQMSRRVFRAIYDYVANDLDEVSFYENDVLIDCVNVDRNWLIGKVARTGKTGMLPANYVTELPSQ